MARKISIEFLTGSWYIEASSTNGVDIEDIAFGGARENEGKIVYIFDHAWVNPKALDEAKKREQFKEMCDFHDTTHDKHFAGSFIDALEYIKREFER